MPALQAERRQKERRKKERRQRTWFKICSVILGSDNRALGGKRPEELYKTKAHKPKDRKHRQHKKAVIW